MEGLWDKIICVVQNVNEGYESATPSNWWNGERPILESLLESCKHYYLYYLFVWVNYGAGVTGIYTL